MGKFLPTDGNIDMVAIPVFGETTMNISALDVERLWKSVNKTGTSTCWLWLGSTNSKGYGHITIQGRLLLVHRITYFLLKGDLNSNLEIMHKCNNPLCCNPDHLAQGTHQQNMQQAAQDKRWPKRGGPGAYLGLTEEHKRLIKTSPLSARALSRIIPISYKTISAIRKVISCPVE